MRPTPTAPPASTPAKATATVATPVTPTRRARASGLAMISLVLGVSGALLVMTGVLAAVGVAVGVVGLLFGLGGISATKQRHVAGRFEAIIGTMLSLATMAIGTLAMSDMISWLNTDTNYVTRLNEWLVAQMPWLDRF